MRAKLVTAYVPIVDHPRSAAEYGALGERLGGVPVPKKAFYDQVQNLWLHQYVKAMSYMPKVSVGDNPAKNTLAYHAVNHQKSTWLVEASKEDPDADVLVWVDYGIFHLPDVCNFSIVRFMNSLDDKAIYAPGCWDKVVVESAYPCWRFCGSVIAVPKKYVTEFDAACRAEARHHINATHNVEWEVNTWARVEQKRKYKFPIRWYQADHNVSIFDNLPQVVE